MVEVELRHNQCKSQRVTTLISFRLQRDIDEIQLVNESAALKFNTAIASCPDLQCHQPYIIVF